MQITSGGGVIVIAIELAELVGAKPERLPEFELVDRQGGVVDVPNPQPANTRPAGLTLRKLVPVISNCVRSTLERPVGSGGWIAGSSKM